VNGWQTQHGPNPPSAGNASVQSSSSSPQSGTGNARVNSASGVGSNNFRVLYRNMASTWAGRPMGSDNMLITGWVYVPSTTTGFFNFEIQGPGGSIGIRRETAGQLRGYFGGTTTGLVNFNTNTWNKMELYVGRTTGTAQYFLNGSSMGTISSGSINVGWNPVNWGALSFVPTGSGLTGPVHVDTMKFEAVPEPASMAALGLGLAAMIRRRKAKKA
jgi:hypothetical protein